MASRPFAARWDGECAECGAAWCADDEIRYNDAGELVGEECCGFVYDGDDEW